MKDDNSIFGKRPEKLDRLLRLGLHETRDPAAIPPLVLTGVAEQPGSRIGRYRLLETIGEGGMGVVYRAEQAEPVRREVALKIIKPGMDSHRVLARFEAEEQTLALMEHPHIARVYDAGVAPSGRPYFVMELVKGLPVTDHCDKNRLTIEQRLHLFLRVCHGRETKLGPEHPRTLESLCELVRLYESWPKPEEAQKWRAKLPPDGAAGR